MISRIKELVSRLANTMNLGDQKTLKKSSDRVKKFVVQDKDELVNDFKKHGKQSTKRMKKSSLHGAGRVEREKTNTNKRQENFEKGPLHQ